MELTAVSMQWARGSARTEPK